MPYTQDTGLSEVRHLLDRQQLMLLSVNMRHPDAMREQNFPENTQAITTLLMSVACRACYLAFTRQYFLFGLFRQSLAMTLIAVMTGSPSAVLPTREHRILESTSLRPSAACATGRA